MGRDEETRLRRSIGRGASLREVERLLDVLAAHGPPPVKAGEVIAATAGRGAEVDLVQWSEEDAGTYVSETLEEFGEANLTGRERARILGDEDALRAAVACGAGFYDLLALRRLLVARLTPDDIERESEHGDLYFAQPPWPWKPGKPLKWSWPPKRRVAWLPRGWPIQASPNDAAEGADPREALCWIRDEGSPSGANTEWHWLLALSDMEPVTEAEARKLDPGLFKGLLLIDHAGRNVVRVPGRLFGTEWRVVGEFRDFESAVEFAKDKLGADDEGFIEPITETESMHPDWDADEDEDEGDTGCEYVIDLPDFDDPEAAWLYVDTFRTRREAEEFVHKHVLGGTEDGRVKVIATTRRHEAETKPWGG